MTQTKAEQLADECDNFGHGVEPLNISVVARELRRLSPMEAERDKLLEINKVLVGALKEMVKDFGIDGHGAEFEDGECHVVDRAREALKLSGWLRNGS